MEDGGKSKLRRIHLSNRISELGTRQKVRGLGGKTLVWLESLEVSELYR